MRLSNLELDQKAVSGLISITFSSGYKVKWPKKCCLFNGGASPISLRPGGLMLMNRESSCKDFRYKAATLLSGCGRLLPSGVSI